MERAGGSAVRGKSFSNGKLKFDLVYALGGSWKNRWLILRALPNELEISRFGFVVSRRVGKAVVRNHIKRLLREIVRQTPFKPGWDVVLIARVSASVAGFKELSESVKYLLTQAGLYGGNENNCSGND